MPTPRHITLEDLHLAQSPQGILNLFGRLGYAVERDDIPLDKNEIGFAPADSAAIKRLFLLADEGGQVQVILFELEDAALTRIRSLAGNLLSRGGNYLIVATQDYRRVVFANPRREAGTVKIRKLVDVSQPTQHDLDVLEGLAVTALVLSNAEGKNPEAIFQAQYAAFDVEKVTDRFYREYAGLFRGVESARAFYEPQELHTFTGERGAAGDHRRSGAASARPTQNPSPKFRFGKFGGGWDGACPGGAGGGAESASL